MKNSLGFEINNKSIIKFAGMSILLMMFISLYVMIDGVFISNYVGDLGLTAINIVFPVTSFFTALAIMFGTGGGAICATKIGEKLYRQAKIDFSAIFTFALIFITVLIIPVLIYIKPIVYALGANDKFVQYSIDYLFIYLLFAPAFTVQLLCQFFLFTAGKPQKAFKLTFIGGITNIIFDYIFIALLDMELKGAALATGFGELAAGGYGVYCFIKLKRLSLRFVKPTFPFKTILSAMVNGSSEMVGSVATAIMIYLFNKNMMELEGASGVSAITMILYIEFLLVSAYIGYANGVAPLFSFNHGEKNYYKLRKLFKKSMHFITMFAGLSLVLAVVLADILVAIFTDRDTDTFALATDGLRIFSIGFVFLGFNIFASSMFTAFSNGKISALISFLRTLVFICVFLIILPKYWGVTGVWLAVPIAELLTFLVVLILFKIYQKKYKY